MSPISKRVYRLCLLLFSDIQQREAARQIDVAQPLLSRTLSGVRKPSKTFIEKLANYPGVNARWLFDGIGDPLIEGGTTLPVIERLPMRRESKWEELEQEAERFWISEARFSATRYWWRMNKKTLRSWGERRLECRATAGDYLLLETDRTQIEAMPLEKRLVIASHPEIKQGKPLWGILDNNMKFTPFVQNTSSTSDQNPVPKLITKHRRRISRRKDSTSLDHEGNPNPVKHKERLLELQPAKVDRVPVEIKHVLAVVLEMTSPLVLMT